MVDSVVHSPWLGAVSSRQQYLRLNPKPFISPITKAPPDEATYADGYCAVCKARRTFRIGSELWSPQKGYIFRESYSCSGCTLNARMRAFIQFLDDHGLTLEGKRIYITEKLTPLYRFLQARYPQIEGSEYFSGFPKGSTHLGVQVEDVMDLTYESASFDNVFSFDVMEHVPDYRKAFGEIFRVLRPGGDFIATFPFDLDLEMSYPRARMGQNGQIIHLKEAEFHGNPVGEPSLCFTEFGWDLLDVLREVGFRRISVALYSGLAFGYDGREQPIFRMSRPGGA